MVLPADDSHFSARHYYVYDALTDAIFQNGYIIRKVRVHVTLRQFIITEAFCREVRLLN